MFFLRKVQARSMAMTPPVIANNVATSLADVSHLNCQKAQQITLRIAKVRRIFKAAFFTVRILSVDIGQVCSASYFFRKSTSASTPSLGMAL